jgi:hypothetical protein
MTRETTFRRGSVGSAEFVPAARDLYSKLVSKHIPSAKKSPFAAYAKVVRALQRVTISVSWACLYPPSKAARLFYCLRPGAVRRLSYVHHKSYRDVSYLRIRLYLSEVLGPLLG